MERSARSLERERERLRARIATLEYEVKRLRRLLRDGGKVEGPAGGYSGKSDPYASPYGGR